MLFPPDSFEAVDELFQHTLEWKIMHNFSPTLPFQSNQTLILDKKPSTCLKVRLPPDASRMQWTSCCSTPFMSLILPYNFVTVLTTINFHFYQKKTLLVFICLIYVCKLVMTFSQDLWQKLQV